MANFAKLKKSIALILVSFYLLSISEFNQLLKLPMLVQHFIEHQSEDESLTFSHFLVIHYTHGNVVDDDYSNDMKLPFKTNHANIIASFIALEIAFDEIKINRTETELTFAKLTYSIPLVFTSSVFQPPKSA
jgi:hypothetical protein